MVIHKLDEQHVLHLEDRVCDFIPEFARHGKDRITIRHLLAHKAGIPNLPPDAMDLDLLGQPEKVVEIMCDAQLRSRPGACSPITRCRAASCSPRWCDARRASTSAPCSSAS
jgi:CubicO group peptidase (beta-lactamase class C family)